MRLNQFKKTKEASSPQKKSTTQVFHLKKSNSNSPEKKTLKEPQQEDSIL